MAAFGKSSAGGGTLGPAVAGTWYPSRPDDLGTLVDGLLEAHGPAVEAAPACAIVAPHAGFVYSGRVAGQGFRRLPRGVERVLLLGPSHFAGFAGGCLPEAVTYRTPLGDVPIDVEASARLGESPVLRRDDRPFRPEHSLESELPFLQRRLVPGWRVLPVLIGPASDSTMLRRVADALRPALDARTLVVVSSDFTHYGPRFGYVPFVEQVPERIRQLDEGAIERIVALDREGFRDYVERTGATICGRGAIEVLLGLLSPESRGVRVAYDTSGRMTGDWDHSVSYASLLFEHGA